MRRFLVYIGVIVVMGVPLIHAQAAPRSGIPNRKPTHTYIPVRENQRNTNRFQERFQVLTRTVDQSRRRLETFRTFLTKVQSRIDKLQAQGHDVTRFTSYISTAQAQMTAVESAITHMEQVFTELDVTADIQMIQQTVRTELTVVREAFIKLHTTMKQLVEQLVKDHLRPTISRMPRPTWLVEPD